MRRNPKSTMSTRLIGAAVVPLAFAAVGCAAQGRPALVLAPMPTTSTIAPLRPTLTTRPATSTTTATVAPSTAPATVAQTAAPATTASTATTAGADRGGIAVRLPASTAPATAPPAASTTVVRGQVAPPTPTTALTLDAPPMRRLPDGAFDVAVSGATAYEVVAQPTTVCAVDNGRVVPAAAGACVVRAIASGHAAVEATIRIERGDPVVSWRLGATTPFTFAAVALELRSSSGGAVRATGASGTCRLQDAGSISFALAGSGQLGTCTVTATVDESPLWNGATVTLTTTTTRAPSTVAFDAPGAAVRSFTGRAVLSQADRSLDAHVAFSVRSSNGCTLTVSPAAPAPGTRTATINVSAAVGTSRWCPMTLVPSITDATNVVSVTVPPCRWIWIGIGQATTSAPTACPA